MQLLLIFGLQAATELPSVHGNPQISFSAQPARHIGVVFPCDEVDVFIFEDSAVESLFSFFLLTYA